MRNSIKKIVYLFRIPILWAILAYQKTISPDHGWFKNKFPYGFCRYHPTCSEYGREVIKKRGLLVGIPLAIWRIIRCNPLSGGGIDLP